MYVGGVESGVCGFYTTLHTEYCYSCWRCWRLLYCTLYTVATHPCQEGRLLCEPSIFGGLAVHHWSVWGGSFVKFLGTCQLQGWLQARCTANPQFLKLKGTQQPGNSYISMGTKLHPPYPNQDCLPVVLIWKVSSMLEECGPVQFLWHWQVQSLTQLAHTSK